MTSSINVSEAPIAIFEDGNSDSAWYALCVWAAMVSSDLSALSLIASGIEERYTTRTQDKFRLRQNERIELRTSNTDGRKMKRGEVFNEAEGGDLRGWIPGWRPCRFISREPMGWMDIY